MTYAMPRLENAEDRDGPRRWPAAARRRRGPRGGPGGWGKGIVRAAGVAAAAACATAAAIGSYTFEYDPYVPTPQSVVERMLAIAEVGPSDTVVDLGSGDGRIVITAAKQFGARAIGVEIDHTLVGEAQAAARKEGVEDRVAFLARDFFETDLREATVLTLYLLPETNRKLLPKILAEMRPGARVVSHRFAVGDWRPDATVVVKVEDDWSVHGRNRDLYLFYVPARVAGDWEVVCEGGDAPPFRLVLAQTHQYIGGYAAGAARPVDLERAVLHGKDIRFVVPGGAPFAGDYAGTVEGERMSGYLVGDDRRRWHASRRAVH